MQINDLFVGFATIALALFIVFYVWVAILLIKILNSVRRTFKEIEEKAQSLSVLKESFKVAVLTFLGKILGNGNKKREVKSNGEKN
mgnify:CR=1 FL=1